MKVLFVIGDAFGIGGTIRTTFNLAGALSARGHEVEVLSGFRRRDAAHLPLDPSVRLVSLVEVRTNHPDYDRTDPLRGRPAVVYPADDYRAASYDLMVERRAEQYLRSSDADVVIGTRAGIIAWIAQFAPERMIRIGQEHLTRRMHRKGLRTAMAPHYSRLDAFVTVSQRDADDYRKHLRLPHTRLLFIPNSVPAPQIAPSTGERKLVVAAGRLVGNKRYDLLIRAFAKVVADYPDWQLRVYGGGDKEAELRRLVVDLGLHNHVLMMGGYSPIEPEWAKGSIAAVPSDKEPFGMTLVEAMRCGLPVVSTDAPYGPGEILRDGVDGRLTPVGDVDAFAAALLELIRDPQRRRAMAAAALEASARYDPAVVAARYEELFEQLAADKARRAASWSHRLRGLIRRTEAALAPPPVLGPAPHSTLPTADAVVTPTGDVVVRLPASVVPPGATAVWQRADGTQWRVAVAPPAGDRAEVTLRRSDGIPEGQWTLFLADGQGGQEAVLAGVRDTAALLDAAFLPGEGVRVLLPLRTATAHLGLRVWRRPVHGEVGDVHVSGADIRFAGRLAGTVDVADQAELELRCQADATRIERVPVRMSGMSFHATVPAGLLAGHRVTGRDHWNVFLRHHPDAPAVRLGRFLDDVANKAAAYVYPQTVVSVPGRGDAWVQACYTGANEFAIRVADSAG